MEPDNPDKKKENVFVYFLFWILWSSQGMTKSEILKPILRSPSSRLCMGYAGQDGGLTQVQDDGFLFAEFGEETSDRFDSPLKNLLDAVGEKKGSTWLKGCLDFSASGWSSQFC